MHGGHLTCNQVAREGGYMYRGVNHPCRGSTQVGYKEHFYSFPRSLEVEALDVVIICTILVYD